LSAIKVVLFDLDETLFDHTHASRKALFEVRSRCPVLQSQTIERIETHLRESLNGFHQQVLLGELTLEQARNLRFRGLLAFCGNGLDDELAADLAGRFRTIYQRQRRPVDGVIPLLERLKEFVKVGIVTNNVTREQEDKLRHCQLDRHIDFLVTSEDVGAIKPDSRIFEVALERAACTKEEAVMVGDSWEDDVLGAHGSGIRAVWFNRGALACPNPELALEIRSFEPVERLVELLVGGTPGHHHGRSLSRPVKS
jgi:HAD superfamily hydrolase (TIGR01549 family)